MEEKKNPIYPLTPDGDMFDANYAMKPYAYQQLLMTLLSRYRMDNPDFCGRENVFWVILAMVIEVKKPLKLWEQVSGESRNTERQGRLLRRENAVYLPDGTPALTGAVFHAPFDRVERRIVRDETLYEELGPMEGKRLLEAESRFGALPEHFQSETVLRVLPSWVDFLGHVNTARYGEIAYLALGEERRRRMGELSRLEFYFLRELPKDTLLHLRLSETETESLVVGYRNEEEAPAFIVRLEFGR